MPCNVFTLLLTSLLLTYAIPEDQCLVNDNAKNANNLRYLSIKQKEFYVENGYLLIKEFVPKIVTENLKKEILHLISEFDTNSSHSIFASHRTDTQFKDSYFLSSGDKIRLFWEEFAFDENGEFMKNVSKSLLINKIGHYLHIANEVFHSYVYGYLPDLAFDIDLEDPVPLQSMYIFKQANIGGEIDAHQDSTFLKTMPTYSVNAFWLSIDDATIDNGCIWLVSKKKKQIRYEFKRIGEHLDSTQMFDLDPENKLNILSMDGGIPIETKSGDLLLINGEVVHWSAVNQSPNARHALMVHCIDGKYEYPIDNWLQYSNNKPFHTFSVEDCENQQKIREIVLKQN